jgi:CheY-like chemotaxis protein
VEDEEAVRKMAARLLQRRGYRMLVAENGKEALRLAEAHPGEIDLLLTDMTMPRLNGLDLARRMAELLPGLPIVFMSGYTESPVPAGRIGDSPTAFVHKPFSLDALVQAVRDSLDRARS